MCVMGPSTYDVRFLQGFLTYLPTHVQFCPNEWVLFYLVVSDFHKTTYLPKNWTSDVVGPHVQYRTRAISGRSRLVAAPLRNQAKRHFL